MTAAPFPHLDGAQTEASQLAITDGEVNFLWSFIQGSVMIPETWEALMRGFGLCERHAWVHLSVEMAFRKRHFLGPVILYRALIDKAAQAVHAPQGARLIVRQLRAGGPCRLCELNIRHAAAGACPRARLDRGRDNDGLRAFATGLERFWRPTVCGLCTDGTSTGNGFGRCRRHLIEDLKAKETVDLTWHQKALQALSERLACYEKSFVAGAEKPRDEHRAALISAVGWCSGWRPLLKLVDGRRVHGPA
jgi:hypothetical protein